MDYIKRDDQVQRQVLTDTGDEVVEAIFRKQRVLQPSEVQLQHSGHRVNVMVAFLVNQRVVTLKGGKKKKTKTNHRCVHLDESCDLQAAGSPLSKEFLMSLTSTCDPDTLKMPWC